MNLNFFENVVSNPHYSENFKNVIAMQSADIQNAYDQNDGKALATSISSKTLFANEDHVFNS